MSMFEDDRYCWRETYFVLFDAGKRPTLQAMQEKVNSLDEHFSIKNSNQDETGRFESMTVVSHDDFAALDICYVEGEEVQEQAAALIDEMDTRQCDNQERSAAQQILNCNARFDILHFEEIVRQEETEEAEEMLDPSALLIVLEALVDLTGGIAVDPQGGSTV